MSEQIIFYPEIAAFGGGERVLLALMRHLRRQGVAHRLACYYQGIDLSRYADEPIQVRELRPARNPVSKACSLRRRPGIRSRPSLAGGDSGGFACRHLAAARLRVDDSRYSQPVDARAGEHGPDADRPPAAPALGDAPVSAAIGCPGQCRHCHQPLHGTGDPPTLWTRSGGGATRRSVARHPAASKVFWKRHSAAHAVGQPGRGDWHLDIVGEGSKSEALKGRAASLNLGGRVTFHGHVSDARLEQIYASASLFVMPARQGYGLPALEALARGLPVVMHRESGASEILRESPWVELIDGGADDLASGMGRMLDRIESGNLACEPRPAFPSESDWAEQIRELCGWRC